MTYYTLQVAGIHALNMVSGVPGYAVFMITIVASILIYHIKVAVYLEVNTQLMIHIF